MEIRSARTKITSLEKGLVRMAADFEQASRWGVLGAGGGVARWCGTPASRKQTGGKPTAHG